MSSPPPPMMDAALPRIRSISTAVRETVRELEAALAVQVRTLGEQHADVAGTLAGMGAAYADEGQTAKALETLDRAVRIYAALGDPRAAAEAECDAAAALEADADAEGALRRLEAALRLRREADGEAHEAVLELAARVANGHLAQGRTAEAVERMRQVVAGRRAADARRASSLFDEGDAMADALEALAGVLAEHDGSAAAREEAVALLREALERRRERAAEAPKPVADTAATLGRVLSSAGRVQDALPLLREASAAYGLDDDSDEEEDDEDDSDEDDEDEAQNRVATFEALAAALEAQNDIEGALNAYAAALNVKRETLGDAHPAVADTLAVTGAILLRARAYDGAAELLEEANQIYAASEEADAVQRSGVLRSLARVRDRLEGPEAAMRLLEEALALPGLPAEEQALTLSAKASVASQLKNHEGAAKMYAEADEWFMAAGRGRGDTQVVIVRGARARELDRQGNATEAASLLEEVLAAEQERDANDHEAMASARANLAAVEYNLGNTERARELYAGAVESCRELGEPLALSDALLDLVDALTHLGRHDEALAAAAEALRLREENGLGPEHPDNVVAAHRVALAHDELGNAAEASRLHRRVVRARRAEAEEEPLALADALCCLGLSYRARGMLSRARRALREALLIQTETIGSEDERTSETAAALAEVSGQGLLAEVGSEEDLSASGSESD